MEYLDYFQLTSEPFSNAPLSRFYFASRQHTEALNRLMYAASSMKGLAILIGDIGHGKTTLARRMLDALPESEYEAAMLVIVHAGITPNWLLKRIASQLGVSDPAEDKLTILSQLYQRLLNIYQAGKRAVVIIDEAQMLATRELMEEFRGLLNLEVPDRKLITFVFFGLPEIERNLRLDPPLAQRIALRYQLRPLTAEDTSAYIDHRLRIAGAKRQLFPAPIVQEIHRVTKGVPRLINTVCDNVLLEMFFAKKRVADMELVQQIAQNFGLPEDYSTPSNMPPPMPLEEQLALEGTPGHDAIVSVGRDANEIPEAAPARDATAIPEAAPPATASVTLASAFAPISAEPVPPAVSAEANIIAQRIAEEATPAPAAIDEPAPSHAAPFDDAGGLADALEPESELDSAFAPAPDSAPEPAFSPPSTAASAAAAFAPPSFAPPPFGTSSQSNASSQGSSSYNPGPPPPPPDAFTPPPPPPSEIEDPLAFLRDAPSSEIVEPDELDSSRDAAERPRLADAMSEAMDEEPILLEALVEPIPPRSAPPQAPSVMEVTDSQISEMPSFDIEVVEDGHSLGFGDGMQRPAPVAPAPDHGVPLARIAPVTRSVPADIPETPSMTSGIRLGTPASAPPSTPSTPAPTNGNPTPKPATPPGPLKTTTGRTINLAEIDDLLADISNLTKKT